MDADIEQRIAWQKENEEKLAAWEAEKKAEAERRELQEKRDRLESYLRRREEAWTEHTGTPPTAGMLTRWTEEYVNNTVADQELGLELRRAQAANDFWS
jgi:hypothetical protein